MNTLLVGYDLTEFADYEPLFDALKGEGGWWHHLDSTWLVKSELGAKELRDKLRPVLHAGDALLVIDVTGQSAAWGGLPERAGEWIKKHL